MIYFIILILLILCLVVPCYFTIINLIISIETVFNKQIIKKREKYQHIDVWTICVGVILNCTLWLVMGYQEWNQSLIQKGGAKFHTPLNKEHLFTFIVVMLIGYWGYLYVKYREKPISTLEFVIGLGTTYITNILGLILCIQLCNNYLMPVHSGTGRINFPVIFMNLLPVNFTLMTITLMSKLIRGEIKECISNTSRITILEKINHRFNINSYLIIPIFMGIPILFVVITILLVVGQEPLSLYKVFTVTSDWVFSKY